jgi:hypothetical protein
VSSVTEGEGGELRKIDVLLLTHEYDTEALYVTHPLNFQSRERYPEYCQILLDKVQKKI